MAFLLGGANLPRIGGYNQSVVMDLIRRRAAGVSRTELTELTGLSPQTVSNVTRRLIASGVVRELGQVSLGPGKPRTLLGTDPSGCFAVGVHVDPFVVDVIVLDVAGNVVTKDSRPTATDHSASHILSLIASMVKRIVRKAAIDSDRLVGVGVATPGPVDHDRGVVVDPPLLPRWRNVAVAADLERRLSLPVTMEKDAVAATIGETWVRSDEDSSSFIFCYLGTGIGLGAAIDGATLRGLSNNFGDIGHLIVSHDGPACGRCGQVGELGPLLEPWYVVDRAVRRGAIEKAPGNDVDQVNRAFLQLWASARAGDPAAVDVTRQTIEYLAVGVARVTDLLDINEVVFGGPWWSHMAQIVLGGLPGALARLPVLGSVRPIELRSAQFTDNVGAVGAAALVLEAALAARPEQLVHRSASRVG